MHFQPSGTCQYPSGQGGLELLLQERAKEGMVTKKIRNGLQDILIAAWKAGSRYPKIGNAR